MDGFINLLKPPGMTSSDAVLYVRRMLPRGTRVGHGGTLDPEAAGVLPICVGRATRLFDYFIDKEKEYLTEVTFGVVTDTQDATGRVLEKRQLLPDEKAIRESLPALTGDILQTPPVYSAIKQGGKRLYQMARQGQQVQVQPRPVRVEEMAYVGQTAPDRHLIRITCRKGVYVRTLMHDLGQILGCGGHVSLLLRTKAGAFSICESMTLEQLRTAGELEECLLPMDTPLMHLPAICLDESCRHGVINGNPVRICDQMEPGLAVRVYLVNAFVGIGEVTQQGMVKFRAMLMDR